MLREALRAGIDERTFWRLTPRQVHRRIEVWGEQQKERREREMRMVASLRATIINHAGFGRKKKDMVKPDYFLQASEEDEETAEEQRLRLMNTFKLDERFGWEA